MGTRKRKLSVMRLPVQRELELSHEGQYFDLRSLFDKLNAEYFNGALRGYTITWGRKRKLPRKNTLYSGRSRKRTGSSGFIRFSMRRSFRPGFSSTSSITRCCTRLYRKRKMPLAAVEFIPMNSTVGNSGFIATRELAAGRTKTWIVFCDS